MTQSLVGDQFWLGVLTFDLQNKTGHAPGIQEREGLTPYPILIRKFISAFVDNDNKQKSLLFV